ncbi:hypothetical protein EW026_g8069 [Hermanssonia centrifuga]|uniref:Uncharacterized protein n=1 Tax=Hermanssonia centrifuga TaxID=98765 RepID=A0A4S4K7E6_9APHY|nr:hypothetical protein EW026_g8069 [Hermanssonia centrifuga]
MFVTTTTAAVSPLVSRACRFLAYGHPPLTVPVCLDCRSDKQDVDTELQLEGGDAGKWHYKILPHPVHQQLIDLLLDMANRDEKVIGVQITEEEDVERMLWNVYDRRIAGIEITLRDLLDDEGVVCFIQID